MMRIIGNNKNKSNDRNNMSNNINHITSKHDDRAKKSKKVNNK